MTERVRRMGLDEAEAAGWPASPWHGHELEDAYDPLAWPADGARRAPSSERGDEVVRACRAAEE